MLNWTWSNLKRRSIYLNNTTPVQIDSIYATKNLEFRGSGELQAVTDGQFGLNVGNHLRAFKNTKYGQGKVSGTGNDAGIRVVNEIQMDGGTLEAQGVNYGIWCNNDIKPYYTASIKAVATGENSTGIWAYRDIYAWKGAKVYAEGGACGGYTAIAHIQAENNSEIKGVSRDITSCLSALHCQKQMLRAYSSASVIEEYVYNRALNWRSNQAVDLAGYASVNRNLKNVTNYNWSVEGTGQILNIASNGITMGSMINATLIGVRPVNMAKIEPTQLKSSGKHVVQVSQIVLDRY